jgi:signal transduction histidine kinase
MIIGLKLRFSLIYGTTIFAVVLMVTGLIIAVFTYHFSSLHILNSEMMEYFRSTFIAVGVIFVPVGAFFSYTVGFFISEQLHKSKYKITPQAAEAPPLSTAILEEEFQNKIISIGGSVDKMREAYDQIQHFSVSASHELRTPLTIIRGEIELALRHQKNPEQYQDILVSLLEEVLRLSRIIDDLLLVAKSQIGQVPMERQEIDLKQFVEDFADEAEMFATQSDISFKLLTVEDSVIMGDALRLRRVLLNLIDNAVKYNTPNGSVTLSLESKDGDAVLRVKDTGIGIPEAEQRKVFDRFYRIDKEHSNSMGGTGLGLYIVRWVVETHGGTIALHSSPGEGTEFEIRLPLLLG